MMNTSSPDTLLKIESVGLSLLNFSKITINYELDNIHLISSSNCNNATSLNLRLKSQWVRPNWKLLTASQCSLSWCINRYSAKEESGFFHEQYMDSWQLRPGPEIVSPPRSSIEYVKLAPFVEGGNLAVLEQNVDRTNADNIIQHGPAQDETSFTPCYVEVGIHTRLGNSMARFFTTNLKHISSWDPSRADLTVLDPAVVLYGMEPVTRKVPDTLRATDTQRTDPVTKVSSDVAHGLTQYIRQGPTKYQEMQSFSDGDGRLMNGEGNSQAMGMTFEDRIIVRVRWGWLSFPVGLVTMTVLLTIATKLWSSRQNIPAWGSSTAALMIRGPYSHIDDTASLNLSADQMQKKAKSTKVTFERSTDGSWRLVERRHPAIRNEATDLESAVSSIPQSKTYKMREHPKPTGTSTKTPTGSLIAASGTRGREATVAIRSPRQKPRFVRSQPI
ncbi:MAG: hypothetical protein Q9205_007385 [Flavoplaca limonia]